MLAATAALRCGKPYDPGTSEASEGSDASSMGTSAAELTDVTSGVQTVTTVTQTSTTGEPETTGTSTTGEPFDCAAAVDALTPKLAAGEPCEVLLQLDETGAPLGWSVACGASGTTWTSGKEVQGVTACCSDGATIYGPDPDVGPIYVLHQTGGSPDGVAIVSNHTGTVVYDATTAADAPGPVSVPAAWDDPAALAVGQGCGDPGLSLADALSYDLEKEGEALAQDDLDALATVIGDTALAAALAGASDPVRAVVVRYAPQDKGPSHAIVLFEVTGK